MKFEKYKGHASIVKVTELPLQEFNPMVIIRSGQVFRMNINKDRSVYQAITGDKCVTFTYDGIDSWTFDCSMSDFKTIWMRYFDFKTDYGFYNRSIDPDDEFLREAANYSQGMRILHQDLWETMVTFIISQQNNIPKIQKSVSELCKKFGAVKTKRIFRDWKTNEILKEPIRLKYYAFPYPSQIAVLSLSELCDGTMLGYRGEYILKLAQDTSKCIVDLQLLERKFSPEYQKDYLLNIKGIGDKVANCIMLYGLHNMESYPIDVWIKRVIEEEYPKMLLEKYLQYINENYKGYQGYIQQIQFYYERSIYKKQTDTSSSNQ